MTPVRQQKKAKAIDKGDAIRVNLAPKFGNVFVRWQGTFLSWFLCSSYINALRCGKR